MLASLLLGIVVATWHAPLFATGMYANAWLHAASIIALTIPFTLLHIGSRGSVLLAMLFHTSWNLSPEIVLYSSFADADYERSVMLFLAGGIVVSIGALVLGWRVLTDQQRSPKVVPARDAQLDAHLAAHSQ